MSDSENRPTDDGDAAITRLLVRLREGDAAAGEQLVPLIYERLHARAAAAMRGEHRQVTMQPTVLVHEAWMRLQSSPAASWEDRGHFLRLAGRVMRNILVERARRRRVERDGGVDPQVIAVTIGGGAGDQVELLDLHAALERLAARDPELGELVDMRFFAGLTLQEAADLLGRSVTSLHRSWEFARSFLLRELGSS